MSSLRSWHATVRRAIVRPLTKRGGPIDQPVPATTVVITPREAHSPTLSCIRHVADHTPEPRRIIVIDGGAGRAVRRRLERLAEELDLVLIRCDGLMMENETRRAALPHVTTEFVVWLDNADLVADGWLGSLETRARATGAAIVTPIIVWGTPGQVQVHSAGSTIEIVEQDGRARSRITDPLIGLPIDELGDVPSAQVHGTELHCALIRTDMLCAVGVPDDALIGSRSYSDLSLRVMAAGGTIWREPSVLVRYDWPRRLRPGDQAFFAWRWRDRLIERSVARFNAIWDVDDPVINADRSLGHRTHRVRRWGRTPPPGWRRVRWRWAHRTRRALDLVRSPLLAAVGERRYRRAGPPRVSRMASWSHPAPEG